MTETPRPTLRLGKPAPPKVAAMVAALAAPPKPKPGPKPQPKPPLKPAAVDQPKKPAKPAAWMDEKAAKRVLAARAQYWAGQKAEKQRIAWRIEDLKTCREQFGPLFDPEQPRPLALGIHKQLGKVIGLKRAKRLMEWWTDWAPYVAALAAGGKRYNLDGSEAGEVTEAQRERARAALKLREPARVEAA